MFEQLVEHDLMKRIGAGDLWHRRSRLMRKVHGHTVAILLKHHKGNLPRQFAHLLA